MKYQNKFILLLIMFFIFLIMSVGCTGNIPTIPGINPNPTENPANSTVSYVEVSTSSSTIKINQTQQLVVKGYNSDDEWVILDKSKVKLWDWSTLGCPACFEGFLYLSPKSGSLTTTFSCGKVGTFYIVAYYQENLGDDYLTDFTEIKVVN